MKQNSKIIFLNKKIKSSFGEIKNNKNKELFKWLVKALKDIEENSFCGVQIPKRLIPKEYLNKYKINMARN